MPRRVFADPFSTALPEVPSEPNEGSHKNGNGNPASTASTPQSSNPVEALPATGGGAGDSPTVPQHSQSAYRAYVDQARTGVVPVISTGSYTEGHRPSLTLTTDSPTPPTMTHHAVASSIPVNNVSSSSLKLRKPAPAEEDTERVFLRNPLEQRRGSTSDDDEVDTGKDKQAVGAVDIAPTEAAVVAPLSQERLQLLEQRQASNDGDYDDDDDDEALRKDNTRSTLSGFEEASATEKDKVCCRVSSLLAVAVLMCLGAVIVGLLGFLPFYFIGVHANGKTTEFLLAEATKGVATITQNSVSMLPAFVHIIAFNYIKRQETTWEDSTLPEDASELVLSLTTVLTRFKRSIQYLTFVVEDELYAQSSYSGDFSMCRAAYNETPGVSPKWFINETTDTFAEPLSYLGMTDFYNITHSPHSAMQEITVPWSRDTSRGDRWLRDNMELTSIYFDYVLPFSIDGRLGYCEAGLPSYNIMNETYKLMPALREHGRVVILDYHRGIVIQNSWNQGSIVTLPGNGQRYRGLTIGEISDDVMKAAVAQVNASGGFQAIMNGRDTFLVTFKYKGNDANLNLTRLTDRYGLDILLGAAVVRADFEKAFATARSVVIGVTVGVVVLAAVVALGIAYVVVKPLKQLGPELKRASELDISDDKPSVSGGCCGGIFITEIRDIQKAYRRLKRSLCEMKAFVPQSMMTTDAAASGSGEDGGDANGNKRSGGGSGEAGAPKRDLRLNTKIFKEQINEFKKKSCTMVLIELRCTPDADSVRATIDVITETVGSYSGCVEQIGLNHMLISFGAHAPLPLHAAKGCNFILDVYYRLPQQLREYVVCLVDNSEFMVGTCGARNRNSRVVFGVGHLVEITKVLWDIGCHVAATPTTSSHMPPVQSVPVECVQLQGSKSHTVLCELHAPPPADCVKQVTTDCELMRDGFSLMCSGDYQMAMANYSAVSDKSNVQVQRLLRICQQRVAAGDRSNYVRATEDVYHFAYKAEDSGSTATSQTAEAARVWSATGTSATSSQAGTQASAGQQQSASGRGGSGGFGSAAFGLPPRPGDDPAEASTSCPLFDMMGNSTASSDDYHPGVPGNPADLELPLTLTDTDGGKWSRSINKISDGAFSIVYLGMSEDGVQVAIKCIPRRRRDIKEADIEAEMHMASSLRHPNVVQYVACSMTQTHLAIIMEYVPGGSLYTVIENFGKLNPTVVRRFMTDIVNGLAYLHEGGIVHCDVKPHNMLLGVNGVCKLSDFGSTISEATDFSGSNSEESNLRGTALYMAPEVANGEKSTQQSDIFSLGVSFLEMLLGRLPWQWSSRAPANVRSESLDLLYRSDMRFVQMLSRGYVEVHVPDNLDRDALKFAKACCHTDPRRRATALDLLSNPFLL